MFANVLNLIMTTNSLVKNLVERLENLRSSVVHLGRFPVLNKLDTFFAEAAINGSPMATGAIYIIPKQFAFVLINFKPE